MSAYVPGEQPREGDVIKLNTNENPYPPSPRVAEALAREIGGDAASLRLYPDPEATRLRQAAAEIYGFDPRNILCGNGSDELLSIIARAFLGEGNSAVFPYPTYSLYSTICEIQGAETVSFDYPRDFSMPAELFSARGDVMFLCNPNSPSGSSIPPSAVEKIARGFDGLVVVDEAYAEFSGENCLDLARTLDNVVVVRTFSKSHSLAGLRLGLLFGPERIVAGLRKVKDSYNLDRLTLAAGEAALRDTEWVSANAARICATRSRMIARLRAMGLDTIDSRANFVLVRLPGDNARRAYEYLKERRILVRYFRSRLLEDALRITVGTDRQTDAMLECLEGFLRKSV
jgi:histidinol-phosphate aminotransferase